MTTTAPPPPDAWWRHLVGRPFYWALDGSHPAASLLMLTEVLERPPTAPAVAAARLALREWLPVEAAIAALAAQDGWPLAWRLRALGELGISGDDERIAEATDRLLDSLPPPQGLPNENAIMLSVPLALGYHDDDRVAARLATLVQLVSAGEWLRHQPAPWLAQALIALALAPATPAVGSARQQAAAALLAQAGGDDDRLLGAPVGPTPDLLATTRALMRCGVTDGRLAPWVAAVETRQLAGGGWVLDTVGPGDLGVERPGEPSRWLTAQAIAILRPFYGE